MEHILGQEDENNVLICMHGRAMRILFAWLMGHSLRHMDTFPHSNLGLYELTKLGDTMRIDRFNDTAHLNGLAPKV